jgi:outer membrane protein assembly factor BamB
MISLRLALLALAIAGLAGAGEPMIRWGGGNGANMVSVATNLPADPDAMEPLWEVKLGVHQYSIPTLDRGLIFLGTDDRAIVRPGYTPSGGGAVICLEQATGKLLWQFASPRYMPGVKPPFHFDQWRCGICSGPVVDGERVYVVGNRGDILCLSREGQARGNIGPFRDELDYMAIAASNVADRVLGPNDGDLVWRYDMLTELGVIPHDVCGSTLLLVGDLLFACTSNGLDDRHAKVPAPQAPTLIALDKHTGRLVAKDNAQIGQRILHGNWSSPVAGHVKGRTLVFFGGGDGILYAFELPQIRDGVQDLKQVWAYDCNPPDFRFRDGQPLPYSAHNRNMTNGPSEIIGTPVFEAGRLYVAIGQSPVHGVGRGCLSCVDAATGKKIWESQQIGRSLATAAIVNGLLYIPDNNGNLYCFDAVTGQRYWTHPLGAKVWGSSAFVADGKVYVGTEASVLWVLKAGRKLDVLSRTRLKSVPITPAAADGVLYLPTQRQLTAISNQRTSKLTGPSKPETGEPR